MFEFIYLLHFCSVKYFIIIFKYCLDKLDHDWFVYVLSHTQFQGAGQLTPQGRASWILWSVVDSLGMYFRFDINCKEIKFILFAWTGIKMVCLGFGASVGMAKEGTPIWHVLEVSDSRTALFHALRCFISAARILQFWHQSVVVYPWY